MQGLEAKVIPAPAPPSSTSGHSQKEVNDCGIHPVISTIIVFATCLEYARMPRAAALAGGTFYGSTLPGKRGIYYPRRLSVLVPAPKQMGLVPVPPL